MRRGGGRGRASRRRNRRRNRRGWRRMGECWWRRVGRRVGVGIGGEGLTFERDTLEAILLLWHLIWWPGCWKFQHSTFIFALDPLYINLMYDWVDSVLAITLFIVTFYTSRNQDVFESMERRIQNTLWFQVQLLCPTHQVFQWVDLSVTMILITYTTVRSEATRCISTRAYSPEWWYLVSRLIKLLV